MGHCRGLGRCRRGGGLDRRRDRPPSGLKLALPAIFLPGTKSGGREMALTSMRISSPKGGAGLFSRLEPRVLRRLLFLAAPYQSGSVDFELFLLDDDQPVDGWVV